MSAAMSKLKLYGIIDAHNNIKEIFLSNAEKPVMNDVFGSTYSPKATAKSADGEFQMLHKKTDKVIEIPNSEYEIIHYTGCQSHKIFYKGITYFLCVNYACSLRLS